MSTNIAKILGRKEFSNTDTKRSAYMTSSLNLTRFSGGKDGIMLQLSTGITQDAHIQLNKEQVEQLRNVLAEWEILPEDID